MNNSNDELLNRIVKDEPPASSKEEQLRKALTRWFDGRRNAVSVLSALQLLASLVLLLVGASLLMTAHETRLMLVGLAAVVFGMSLNLQGKLWCWTLDSKLGVLKELKLMQLSSLETTENGDDTEMNEAQLEQLLPENFLNKPPSILARVRPKTMRWIAGIVLVGTAVVASLYTVAPAADKFGSGLFSAYGVSQEDELHITASDSVAVRSRVSFAGAPADERYVVFALPYASAELTSVTCDGTPLPYSKMDWRRHEVELPALGFGEGGRTVLVEWKYPISALKAEGDGFRTSLCTLLPVARYQLDVVVAPDSGFEVLEQFRETDASGTQRCRPFFSSFRRPVSSFGSCGLCIRRKDV